MLYKPMISSIVQALRITKKKSDSYILLENTHNRLLNLLYFGVNTTDNVKIKQENEFETKSFFPIFLHIKHRS